MPCSDSLRRIAFRCLAALTALAPGTASLADEVLYISEFMAQNDSARKPDGTPVRDEDNSNEDWIEIWNAGTEPVNLHGWSLTDRPTNLRRWTFPQIVIAPDERIVVWASGKDRTNPGGPLHTNFKLSSSGDYLALVHRNGETIVHEWAPAYPPQPRNQSFGMSAGDGEPAYFAQSTPGAPNGPGNTDIPPLVLDVPEGAPFPPPGPVTLIITARVVPAKDPVSEVTLTWRRMFEEEFSAPMRDDGQAPDAAAGDNIWTGTISGVELAAGEMLRWRVTATDTQGRTGKAPPAHVPNDSAIYYGTVADDPSLPDSVPVLHWFMAPGVNPNTASGGRVTIAYLGELFDNVHANLHGQSTASFPKKSYNLDFPTDRQPRWAPDGHRVADLKLLSNYADKTKCRNTLAYEMFREAGVAAHFAFPVRVHRNGQFYALADLVEDADEDYLTRAGLNPDGALYKLYAPLNTGLPSGESGYEKKTRKFENAADLNALAEGLKLTGTNRLTFGYDNIDIPATINYLAALNMTHNNDTGHKNYFLYRDTGRTDEWRLLPWDVDLSFGHNWTGTFNYFDDQLYTTNPATPSSGPGSSNLMFRFGYNGSPAIAEMYLRRLRTLRDRFLAESGSDDWHFRRFNAMMDLLDPQGGPPGVASLDYEAWTPAPWKLSGAPQNNSPFRNNTPREEVARVLDTYVSGRRTYLYKTMASMPPPQPAKPALRFGAVEFNPPLPDGPDGEYFVIENQEPLAIDISGWKVTGAVSFEFPGGTVIPSVNRATASDPDRNRLYVARNAAGFRKRQASPKGGERRLVVSGYSGQLSARGESLELRTPENEVIASTSWEGAPTPAQQFLRISELHFAPLPPSPSELAGMPDAITTDFEFIEFVNIGPAALDVGGVSIIEGVQFTLPEGTSIPSGGRLVVAANVQAFALRYPGVAAAGNWSGRLDNSGERIHVVDRSGETVLDFRYESAWLPSGAPQGRSYQIADEAGTPWNAWGVGSNWVLSSEPGGDPGASREPPQGTTAYAKWRAANFPGPALEDPAISGPEADPDGDGLTNAAEYAFARDPNRADPDHGIEPVIVRADGASFAGIRFRRPAHAADVTWTLEALTDPATWTPLPATLEASPSGDAATETVTLRPDAPLAAPLILRVRAALADP